MYTSGPGLQTGLKWAIGECMHNRKANLRMGVVLLFFGSMSLLRMLGNPRLAALHGSDIVALTGCGACFGVAFVALLGRVKLRKE